VAYEVGAGPRVSFDVRLLERHGFLKLLLMDKGEGWERSLRAFTLNTSLLLVQFISEAASRQGGKKNKPVSICATKSKTKRVPADTTGANVWGALRGCTLWK